MYVCTNRSIEYRPLPWQCSKNTGATLVSCQGQPYSPESASKVLAHFNPRRALSESRLDSQDFTPSTNAHSTAKMGRVRTKVRLPCSNHQAPLFGLSIAKHKADTARPHRPSRSPPRSSSSATTRSSPWTSRPTSASATRSPSSPASVCATRCVALCYRPAAHCCIHDNEGRD